MSNRAIPPLLAPRESEPLWIEPSQARSRARVERILAAARELLGEHGLVGLTMDAVARRADIPIGSLYQFFPDRNALIARLFHAQLMATDALVMEALSGARSMAELRKNIATLPRALYRYIADAPALVEIWRAVQSIRALRHLDTDDSRRMGLALFEAIRGQKGVSVDEARLARACFLVCDLLGAVVQAALEQDPAEGWELVEEWVLMAESYFDRILANRDS
ncbi:TetR/AcrR family transcriptional regulator [Microbulbifer taiwanensis]|uniref:TetR/AcrR family transcriptional regulator n=2 Tax=Microbulbifer taiwanensis TaxID=986746 RepID=A0ABW1YJS6_9GAMM